MSDLAYRIDGQQVLPEAFYAAACDPSRSIAVEACAGAGKTWMLVSRILRTLLDGAPPQDILAITFTRKAAGEMRARLLQELRSWAGADDAALLAALRLRGIGPAQAQALMPAARVLHRQVSASGRSVQLLTFHAWFAALLRAAPMSVLQAMQLPPRFELLDQDERAVERVWPRFFAAVRSDPNSLADFETCVAQVGRHQTLEALRKALSKRVEFVLSDQAGVLERSVQPMGEVFPRFAPSNDPVRFALEDPTMRAALNAAARVLGKAPQPSFAAEGRNLETALSTNEVAGVLSALFTKDFSPRKFTDRVPDLPVIRAAQDVLAEALSARRQHAAWEHHHRLVRLVRVLVASYADLKRQQGWVDMNDVEMAARRLLGDAELSGWLQQRLDARVRHLLIDEFQDTNPLQWQALYGWLSAYAGAGVGEAPSVFLVGDPKQSIYRFRRAEPQVFRAAQRFVVQGLGGALLSCDHTRRCATAVVGVVNHVMGAAVQAGEYGQAVGTAFRPHTTASPHEGSVLVLPAIPRPAGGPRGQVDASLEDWRDSLHTPRHEPEDTLAAQEARQAARWIAAEIASGVVQPGDVMVLARKRERLGWLHEALRDLGIPADQPDKGELNEVPAVQDVVALLDALISPGHDLSLARALRSPIGGWSDEDLTRLARHRLTLPQAPAPTWWDALQHAAACNDAPALWQQTAARWQRWQQLLRSLPPHDALSSIYTQGDLLARFAAAAPQGQGPATLAALRELLLQSLAQDGGRYLSGYRFVRALKAGGVPRSPVNTPGSVRLLTVHGAKGLEAHTVLLLDTDGAPAKAESMGMLIEWPGQAPVPQRFVFLLSEKLAPLCAEAALQAEQTARALEELNALYVALTRAEARVVVSSCEPHRSGDAPTWWRRLTPLAQPLATPAEASALAPCAAAFELPTLPALLGPMPALRSAQAPPEAPADDITRIGRALHRLLQWCPTPAHDFSWSDAHRQAVAREFALAPAAADQALRTAQRMLRGEAAWLWDDARVDQSANEIELVHAGESLRLDRLVRERASGHWWVIDFKSAAQPDRQDELIAQMRRYARAMGAAQPQATVRLAFLNAQGRLIEVTDQVGTP